MSPPQANGQEDCLDLPVEQPELKDLQRRMLWPISERIQDLAVCEEVKC